MKTLYSKLLLLSISALIIGFILLTLGFNTAMTSFFVEQNHLEMEQLADDFNKLLAERIANGEFSQQMLISEMKSLEQYANLKVWLLMGDTFINTDQTISFDVSQLSDDIEKIGQSGAPIFKTARYAQLPDEQFYSLIYPFNIDGETVSIIYLNKSTPVVAKSISRINRFTLVALVIALLYAAITIFIATKSVSDNIKKLNKGVKFVAKGNFDYQFKTDRKDEIGELCQNFNYMIRELKAQEDTSRRFISDLSHDLRSPITSIKGYIVGVLDGTIPPEKWEKYLNIAKRETDRLTKLINDILDLSKMQSGELTINKSDFDIHSMVLNVLDRFEERLAQKDVEVTFKLAEGDTMVEGDSDLIERVVYNLLDNAVKFVEPDGVIEIMTHAKENKMLIGIRNSGATIPDEKLAKIWQRFSKLDESRGLNKQSSGLGLSIVKEILDGHDEKIDVFSNQYLGVMFVFSLTRSTFKRENHPIA